MELADRQLVIYMALELGGRLGVKIFWLEIMCKYNEVNNLG